MSDAAPEFQWDVIDPCDPLSRGEKPFGYHREGEREDDDFWGGMGWPRKPLWCLRMMKSRLRARIGEGMGIEEARASGRADYWDMMREFGVADSEGLAAIVELALDDAIGDPRPKVNLIMTTYFGACDALIEKCRASRS